QDEFGVRSQNLAEKAIANGFWEREITPVTRPDGTEVAKDDGPRAGVTIEAVSQLKPVFRPDGTVTAGNCCPLNDGAAAVIIMSDTKAKQLGLTPLARIVSTGVSALNPEIMGLGPIEATKKALALAKMSIDDIDLVEINEAFAAQVIPSAREIGIDPFGDKLNVNGGAIAVGHPFGMTGARITTTSVNACRGRSGSSCPSPATATSARASARMAGSRSPPDQARELNPRSRRTSRSSCTRAAATSSGEGSAIPVQPRQFGPDGSCR